jgi:hypothetical protein
MKRAFYLASMLALVAFAPGAGAQNSSSYGVSGMEPLKGKTTTAVMAGPGATCPVGLRALQGTGHGLVRVRGAQPDDVPGQRVHLIIANGAKRKVQSARVVVWGLSPKNRVRSVSRRDESPDASRALDATFQTEDATSSSADLVLPGFTAVNWVALRSITFDDGSTWSVAGGETCRVAPDPLMLIVEQ